MLLQSIELQDFRNYASGSFDFAATGNLVVGANGSGKTNLLEAIAYCGLGKSIRFHGDDELLRIGAQAFRIKADFLLDTGLNMQITFSFANRKKNLHIDQLPIRQLSRIFEAVKVIYCAPEDINLVGGSPKTRRQYFDLAVSQLFPEYIVQLRNYLHIVEQRNSLLKTQYVKELKLSWDIRFIEALKQVLAYRLKYLALINERLDASYRDLSKTVKQLKVAYKSSGGHSIGTSATTEEYLAYLSQIENRERNAERSLIGAHLDDYQMLLNDRDLKVYGSGGQKRISVIVLKLVQAGMVEELTRVKPIMLFDDIFAELDLDHSQRIRMLVDKRYQVLITSPKHDLNEIWSNLALIDLEQIK